MTTRTSTTTVVFTQPFTLRGMDGSCPAGVYEVQTDEESVDGLSFLAWRRTATSVVVQANGATQVISVDPLELDAIRGNGASAPAGATSSARNDNSRRP